MVGLNSDKYLAILPGTMQGRGAIRDWQTFPHVRPLDAINTIQVTIVDESVTVRLNEEVAAQFPYIPALPLSAGLFAQAYADKGGTIELVRFKVWTEKASPP
jgi:hypothetical protein